MTATDPTPSATPSAADRTTGFLGLGPMGLPMAHALAEGGLEVVAWNRTAATVDRLRELSPSVQAAASPREVAARARTVVAMLPDLPQLTERLGGPDGLLAGWAQAAGAQTSGTTTPAPPPLLVIMSTVSPVGVTALGEDLAGQGVHLVDAPVSGGPGGAEGRTLSIMVGGEQEDVSRIRPLLEAIGRTIRHMGPLGTGSLTKACNQAVVGGTLAALGEAVRLAEAGGLDLPTVLEILGGGLAGSEALRQKGERYLTGDFGGGGSCRNQLKDQMIILEAGERYGVPQPVSQVTTGLYAQMVERGEGDLDHSAVLRAL